MQQGNNNQPQRGRPSLSAAQRIPDGDEIPTTSNVKVVVRVRPENVHEIEGGYNTAVQVMDENVLIFDPKEEEGEEFFHGKRRRGRDLTKRKNKDLRYAFDRVFGQGVNNRDIYDHTTKLILDGLLNGYNCSVFAYGATGAGKTFTMLGNAQNPGVIFLTMMDLYDRIEAMKDEKICDVAVSYLEVYNEQIRDLLVPSGFLPIREDPTRGVVVNRLSLHKPHSAEELMHMLEFGNRNRTQHPTDANQESSRSHAVFQVFVRQREKTANISADVRVAKMCLIDLAGSERATVTTNRGARFREGANINRSLLALGNCINALADGSNKRKSCHVPYRNSKLTRLLKDSLGGNCRTVMIAAVSPSSMTYEDTHNTLKYANRAKNIKASLKRNTVSVDFAVHKYAKICEELRQEVAELKEKLRGYEEGALVAVNPRRKSIDVFHNQDLEGNRDTLHSIFKQRLSIRKEIMEFESSDRDISYKLHCKEKTLTRIQTLLDPTKSAELTSRTERSIKAGRERLEKIRRRKAEVDTRMDENADWLKRVESEMSLTAEDTNIPELLALSLRTHHLEVELKDTKRQVRYLRKLARFMGRETSSNEKLISALLHLVKRQHFILKGQCLLTTDVMAEYGNIETLVGGEREVAWADQSMCESAVTTATASSVPDDQFSIAQLLEFPVLSTVNTTPKTPSRRRRKNCTTPRTPCATTPRAPLTPSIVPNIVSTPAGRVLKQDAGTAQRVSHQEQPPTVCVDDVVDQSAQRPVMTKPVDQSKQVNVQTENHGDQRKNTNGANLSFQVPTPGGAVVPIISSSSSSLEEDPIDGTYVIEGVGPLQTPQRLLDGGVPQTDGLVTPVPAPATLPSTPSSGVNVIVGKGQAKGFKKPVVRSMDFAEMQKSSPVVTLKMSFADAVKSPGWVTRTPGTPEHLSTPPVFVLSNRVSPNTAEIPKYPAASHFVNSNTVEKPKQPTATHIVNSNTVEKPKNPTAPYIVNGNTVEKPKNPTAPYVVNGNTVEKPKNPTAPYVVNGNTVEKPKNPTAPRIINSNTVEKQKHPTASHQVNSNTVEKKHQERRVTFSLTPDEASPLRTPVIPSPEVAEIPQITTAPSNYHIMPAPFMAPVHVQPMGNHLEQSHLRAGPRQAWPAPNSSAFGNMRQELVQPQKQRQGSTRGHGKGQGSHQTVRTPDQPYHIESKIPTPCSPVRPLQENNHTNSTLQRMGLPSMVNGLRPGKPETPKYMKLTTAAANKRRRHRRSISSKENNRPQSTNTVRHKAQFGGPQRLHTAEVDENTNPNNNRRMSLARFRSKSSSNLNGGGGGGGGRGGWQI